MSCTREIRDSSATSPSDDGSQSGGSKLDRNTTGSSAKKDTTVTTTGNIKERKEETGDSLTLLEEGKRMIAYPAGRIIHDKKEQISHKLPGMPGTEAIDYQTSTKVESEILHDAKLTIHYPAAHRKLTATNRSKMSGAAEVINIRTDWYPDETSIEWSRQEESGFWKVLESRIPTDREHLHNYTMEVESDSLYKLQISDWAGDGTCCGYGFGWFTITNSNPSENHISGTVIWEATGNAFKESLDTFIWIDRHSRAHSVECMPGVGYVLEDQVVAVREITSNNSSSGVTADVP